MKAGERVGKGQREGNTGEVVGQIRFYEFEKEQRGI